MPDALYIVIADTLSGPVVLRVFPRYGPARAYIEALEKDYEHRHAEVGADCSRVLMQVVYDGREAPEEKQKNPENTAIFWIRGGW